MLRTVSASLDLRLFGPTDMIFSIAVADGSYEREEELVVELDGVRLEAREFAGRHGARLHRVAGTTGSMTVRYSARVSGRAEEDVPSELDLVEYLRPSRYAEADSLTPIARSEFGGLRGLAALAAVSEWTHERLSYVPSSTIGTGGAVRTLEIDAGVCRDYAHVVAGILRALDTPARVAAVYAPGLRPMDFHAVTEAWVDGAWHVVDATRLAPRQTLLRMSAGRDTADTAFLSSYGKDLALDRLTVTAETDEPATDDHRSLVRLR